MRAMSDDAHLSKGEAVGIYRIETLLGRGGMGEVYRAHDAKLNRDVAVKVLPAAFVNDRERLSRFQREARLLASLNHPNIALIHGFEDSDNTHALVMELVEGPTLADRIRQGPIPLDEALAIAKQVCEALEYAHERGIVHRDLKPANIKLTPGGSVKVLDFGLAKAVEGAATSADMSNSPTISAIATQSGILLGTPAYMSPEQARGKPVDRRADIWAFGCVLFEMLAGKPAFNGETVTDTLAAVINMQPDWSLLPATTPTPLRALVRRCLQRETRQRLQAIGDARIAVEEILSGASLSEPAPVQTQARKFWLASAFATLLLAAAASLVVWNLKPVPAPLAVTHFTITLPPGQQLAGLGDQAVALSPDARHLAYVATAGGVQQIYLRAMDRDDADPVPDTRGATGPFFSPDGQWLAFVADGKLKKISLRGRVAQELADVGLLGSGADWGSEHMIAFSPYSSVIQLASDDGGPSQPITRLENGETLHSWPRFLPGNKAVLFTAITSTPSAIAVQLIGGQRRNLISSQGATAANYVSGHLLYAQAGNLMAVPFDLDHLQIKQGAVPMPVVPNVMEYSGTRAGQYSVSASGSLAYVSGGAQLRHDSKLVWVDRKDQKEYPLGAPARSYNQPRLSPDGTRVAVDVVETSEKMQVWIYDIRRDTFTPFTFEGANRHGVWTPDSKRLVFMSNREGPTQIFSQPADGSGGMDRLTNNRLTAAGDILQIPYSISNGWLGFVKLVRPTEGEMWVLPLGDFSADSRRNGQEQRLPVQKSVLDSGPELSPDGRWLAYASEESGQRQIYVQAFPGPGGKQQISTDGGNEPRWNSNGRELFYRSGDKMMAVDISPQGSAAGKPRVLFQGPYVTAVGGFVRPNYDVSPGGQRFLMLKHVDEPQAPVNEIHVVLNWSEELKRLAAAEAK
jgi:serine/threonine-protein kinase